MLVEAGFVSVQLDELTFTFRPSLGRIDSLGTPHEIVAIYAGLHGPKAAEEARHVLASLCDQEDVTPLIGWLDEAGWHDGAIPARQQIIVARHLMQHGICGEARPSNAAASGGGYSDKFDALQYITDARVHLGMSADDAAGLSMTEWQRAMSAKFPDAATKARNVPTREEYEATMAAFEASARAS